MTAPPRLLARPSTLPPELMRALSSAPGEPTATELTELASKLGGALGVALPAPVVAKALPVAANAALAGGAAASGAAASGAAASGAAAGVVAAKPLAVFGAWLVGGLALGAGLSGLASSFLSLDSPAPRERTAASAGVGSASPATAPPPENAGVIPDVPPELPSAQPRQNAGVFEGPRPVARETERALPAPVVASESELSLLKRAREAEPTQALALTAEHARRFPTGALEQEREMIAIDALLRLGRRDVAAQRAKRFQAQYPGSAHARRLSALFDSSTP